MSLRAKIEAVVYAAEEPVSLAQLAAVFAPEVREIWQAERDEAAAAAQDAGNEPAAEQPSTEAVASPEAVPLSEAVLEPAEAETGEEAASPDADGEAAALKRAARNEERAIRDYLRKALDELMAELETGDRGVEIREIAGGYRMATKPEYHDAIRSFVKSLKPPMKLSLQALETLAVVAYKQPVTGPEISEIRGVESAGVLGSLLSRKLITTAGRKQVIGRPILYKTTKEFLLRFGLKDLNELPSIEEFEKMAGELADVDVEPTGEGGLTTSEAERSLNEEDEEAEAVEGEAVDPVVDPAVEESGADERTMEEQKAGEA
ncbi:MAG TPA: SMC-Scp complex subunit ScpB [Acidobacteriaceae bacterium]|nr:SMC-Scp complex subunit ScpB [Acidobacteriaceae bacterium]